MPVRRASSSLTQPVPTARPVGDWKAVVRELLQGMCTIVSGELNIDGVFETSPFVGGEELTERGISKCDRLVGTHSLGSISVCDSLIIARGDALKTSRSIGKVDGLPCGGGIVPWFQGSDIGILSLAKSKKVEPGSQSIP